MKFLIIAGIVLVKAIEGLLLYGLFVPNPYSVSEKVAIDRPIEEIYAFTKSLKNKGQ